MTYLYSQETIHSKNLEFISTYKALVQSDDNPLVVYQFTILNDSDHVFDENKSLKKSGVCHFNNLQCFLHEPTNENYNSLGNTDIIDNYYLTQFKNIELLQNHQISWKKFNSITESFINSLANEDNLNLFFNNQYEQVVCIPKRAYCPVIFSLNNECLYFKPSFYIPSASASVWKNKEHQSLLMNDSINQLTDNEKISWFLQHFLETKKLNVFLDNDIYESIMMRLDINNIDSRLWEFYNSEENYLYELPFHINKPHYYNIAWNVANNACDIKNEKGFQIQDDYENTSYLASMFLFKIQKLDLLLQINFKNLFLQNLDSEQHAMFIEKAAYYYLLENSLEKTSLTTKRIKI